MFGIPGIHVSGILAAIRDEPSIRMVTTRHEQGAAQMADGYARASGKPGVVLVVPGTGVQRCHRSGDRVRPLLARAPHCRPDTSRPDRQEPWGLPEVADQSDMLRSVTKWRRQALTPREIPLAVSEAFRQMRTGRPRPVLIDIPPEAGVERDDSSMCLSPTCLCRAPSSTCIYLPSQAEAPGGADRVLSRSPSFSELTPRVFVLRVSALRSPVLRPGLRQSGRRERAAQR